MLMLVSISFHLYNILYGQYILSQIICHTYTYVYTYTHDLHTLTIRRDILF